MKKYQFALAALAPLVVMGCQGTIPDSGAASGGQGRGGAGDDDDGTSVVDPPSACAQGPSVGPNRWRRLTAAQYQRSVEDLLGLKADTTAFLSDSRTGPFKANALLPAQEGDVGAYNTAAQKLSQLAVADAPKLLDCDTNADGEDACAKRFIESFASRAFRRPLQAGEQESLQRVYQAGKEDSFALGIRMVVETVLQSPSFLYLVEKGEPAEDGLRKLTGYEVASRLSYVLSGTMPDAELMEAARDGNLSDAEGIRTQAKRLMAQPSFMKAASDFHIQLLGIDGLEDQSLISKGDGKFAEFDGAMRTSMVSEADRFVTYVLTKGEGSVKELLTAPYVFPDSKLKAVYGDDVALDEDGRAQVQDGSRHGLLTLAGVMSAHPHVPTPWGAVSRGNLVRKQFLCEEVPPPQIAVNFAMPANINELSPRERLRVHQEDPSCKGCHELMDNIGFGFENYDLLGRFRDKDDRGETVDASGELVGLDDGAFANAGEMSQKLAASAQVRNCLGKQWFRFALGRDPEEADVCTEQTLGKVLAEGNGNIERTVLSLVSSAAFRFNRGE